MPGKRQHLNLAVPSIAIMAAGGFAFLKLGRAEDSKFTVKAMTVSAIWPGATAKEMQEQVGDRLEKRLQELEFYDRVETSASSLILALVMKKGFNGLTLGKLLKVEETAIRKELPVGLVLSKVSDQSQMISESIDEFMIKFVVALAVVMMVSLATLGFRVGIVVAAAVPLTLAAVFVVMLLTGRDFDRVTLGALILSLGLLVDDAIIAIEMMVVEMEEGLDRIQAATFAWTSTASPMLFGTLVTIAGFLPVGFAKSTAGEYAGNIFWVVAFSLIASWFVAVLFTPYLGVKLLPDIKPVLGGHDAIYATPNYRRFRGMVRRVVDHKWIAAGVTVAFFLLSVVGMGFAEKQSTSWFVVPVPSAAAWKTSPMFP